VVMRADNEGEGGILALMSLLNAKSGERAGVIIIGILGAALLYGDGAITPAISVLSAVEGIKAPVPAIAPYVLPLAVVVLVGVFALQPQGSGRIGKLYGPIMALWFAAIGILGAYGILRHPGVLAALDPLYGLEYLFGHGWTGLMVLGGVFLCVTGAEALYADMGHFGRGPIRITWYGLVLPSLLELRRSDRSGRGRGTGAWGQSVLRAVSGFSKSALGCPRDGRDDHRKPSNHQRHVLDDPAGYPARIVSRAGDYPDLLGRLRADLCRLRQLGVDVADVGPGAWFRLIGQPGLGLWHRSLCCSRRS
jgi:K+ potassium transporter